MSGWTRFCGCAGSRCSASSRRSSSWRRGSNSTCPSLPCVAIVGLSALLNLALQIAFNPMQRLEPVYAAALLALNIVELAGAAVPDRRPAEPVLVPVPGAGPDLGDRAAGPADGRARPARGRLRLRAGVLPSAAAVGQRRPAGAAADLSGRRLALDRARDRRHQPLCVPGHRGSAQAVRCAGRDRTGAGARAASDPARRPCRRGRARTRHAAIDHLPGLARAGKDASTTTTRWPATSRPCASRRSAAATFWPRSPSFRRPARRSTA